LKKVTPLVTFGEKVGAGAEDVPRAHPELPRTLQNKANLLVFRKRRVLNFPWKVAPPDNFSWKKFPRG